MRVQTLKASVVEIEGSFQISLSSQKPITTYIKSLVYELDEDEAIIKPLTYSTKESVQEAVTKINHLYKLFAERGFYDILVDIVLTPQYSNEYNITVHKQVQGDGLDEHDWRECELASSQAELNIAKALRYAIPEIEWADKISLHEFDALGIQIQCDYDIDEELQ